MKATSHVTLLPRLLNTTHDAPTLPINKRPKGSTLNYKMEYDEYAIVVKTANKATTTVY